MPTRLITVKPGSAGKSLIQPPAELTESGYSVTILRASLHCTRRTEVASDHSFRLMLTIDSSDAELALCELNMCDFMSQVNLTLDCEFSLSLDSDSEYMKDVWISVLVAFAPLQLSSASGSIQEYKCKTCSQVDEVLDSFQKIRQKFLDPVIDMRSSSFYGCTTLLIGDSILRYVDPSILTSDVYVQSLGGCRIEELERILKCLALDKLKRIILHIGVNNTHDVNFQATKEAAKYRSLMNTCRTLSPNAKLFLSGICPRSDKTYVQQYVSKLNIEIQQLATEFSAVFIDNESCMKNDGDVVRCCLDNDQLHISRKGTHILLNNIHATIPILTTALKVTLLDKPVPMKKKPQHKDLLDSQSDSDDTALPTQFASAGDKKNKKRARAETTQVSIGTFASVKSSPKASFADLQLGLAGLFDMGDTTEASGKSESEGD